MQLGSLHTVFPLLSPLNRPNKKREREGGRGGGGGKREGGL